MILLWVAVPVTLVSLVALALHLRQPDPEYDMIERRNKALKTIEGMNLKPKYRRSL